MLFFGAAACASKTAGPLVRRVRPASCEISVQILMENPLTCHEKSALKKRVYFFLPIISSCHHHFSSLGFVLKVVRLIVFFSGCISTQLAMSGESTEVAGVDLAPVKSFLADMMAAQIISPCPQYQLVVQQIRLKDDPATLWMILMAMKSFVSQITARYDAFFTLSHIINFTYILSIFM